VTLIIPIFVAIDATENRKAIKLERLLSGFSVPQYQEVPITAISWQNLGRTWAASLPTASLRVIIPSSPDVANRLTSAGLMFFRELSQNRLLAHSLYSTLEISLMLFFFSENILISYFQWLLNNPPITTATQASQFLEGAGKIAHSLVLRIRTQTHLP